MKLKDALTLHFIPFRLPAGYSIDDRSKQSLFWQHQKSGIARNAIYDHVADFLTGRSLDDATDGGCIVYAFDPRVKTPLSILFNRKINSITINDKTGSKRTFGFRFCNGKDLTAPKIVLYPQASIGLLSFGVEPVGPDLVPDDLMLFNYDLHKTDKKQAPAIRIPFDESKWKPKEGQTEHPIRKLYGFLNPEAGNEAESYRLTDLRNALLADIGIAPEELCNAERTHLFTYLQVDGNDDRQAFDANLIRILRVQNHTYRTVCDRPSDLFAQLFENIYIGAGVESGVLATVASDDAPEQIRNFKQGTLIPRYLWIYLLVLIQRHTLLSIARSLTRPDHSKQLPDLVERLSEMKVNTYFTDISDYTHLNTFYRLCGERLSIPAYIESSDHKLKNLISILDRKREAEEKRNGKKLEHSLALLTVAQIYFLSLTFFGVETGLQWKADGWGFVLILLPTFYFIFEACKICYHILWRQKRRK